MTTPISSPISHINNTIMNVLIQCVSTNDNRTLAALGVSEESVMQLARLSNKGRCLIGESPAPISQTTIDNKALGLYIERFMAKEIEEELIKQLILAGAPFNLLKKNYGIERNEYATLRIMLNLKKAKLGRPELPDVHNCPKKLSKVLENYIKDKNNIDLDEDPELLLSLSDTHKIGIREVLGYYTQISKDFV